MSLFTVIGGLLYKANEFFEYIGTQASSAMAAYTLSKYQKNHGTEKGWEQLTEAIVNNNSKAFNLFVKAGVSVNTPDQNGNTPLHLIHTAQDAKALIKAGADVNAKNNAGETPAVSAVRGHKEELVKFLVKQVDSDGNTPLHLATDSQGIKAFIAAERDLNAEKAAFKMLTDSQDISAFLKAGGDINAKNNAGETPLEKVIDFLLYSKELYYRGNNHAAALKGHYEKLIYGFVGMGAEIDGVIAHINESEKYSDLIKQDLVVFLFDLKLLQHYVVDVDQSMHQDAVHAEHSIDMPVLDSHHLHQPLEVIDTV